MQGPRFSVLARIDDRRFIAACPHGIAHLTWERATLRFTMDEFQALAGLLGRAASARAPVTLEEGDMRVAWQPDGGEVQAGQAALRLRPAEFRQLAEAVREAQHRLDEMSAAGEWDAAEPDSTPPDPLDGLRRSPFSQN